MENHVKFVQFWQNCGMIHKRGLISLESLGKLNTGHLGKFIDTSLKVL